MVAEGCMLKTATSVPSWFTQPLNHGSSCRHPFTAALLDILRQGHFPHLVTDELRQDLMVWKQFLSSKFAIKSIMKCVSREIPDSIVAIAVRKKHLCGISMRWHIWLPIWK